MIGLSCARLFRRAPSEGAAKEFERISNRSIPASIEPHSANAEKGYRGRSAVPSVRRTTGVVAKILE